MTAIALPARAAAPVRPVLQLAAVEALRLVRHPAFVVGLLLTLPFQVVESAAEDWGGQNYYIAMTEWVWVWVGTLIAAACVAGRNRWLAEPDLLSGTPVTASRRLVATALALVAPVTVTAIATWAVSVRTSRRGGFNLGDPPYTEGIGLPVAQWVQICVLVALAGVVGVALTRLPRARLLALVLFGAATWVSGTAIWIFGAGVVRVLHPFMFPSYEAPLPADVTPAAWVPGDPPLLTPGEYAGAWREARFDTAALWWHLGYVAGLGIVTLAFACRAADRDSRWRPPMVLGVVLLLGCGVLQLANAGQSY